MRNNNQGGFYIKVALSYIIKAYAREKMMQDIFIEAGIRTPIGAFQGALSHAHAFEMAGYLIQNLQKRNANLLDTVQEVILGCVLMAGQGQAPARQAALHGGLPITTPTMTLNKVCGSGMKSIMLACDQIQLGRATSVLAGGMESMSKAPYVLPNARSGYRFGHGLALDHMLLDGLEDAYPAGWDNALFKSRLDQRSPMGSFADALAQVYGFSRSDQEAFALQTYEKYQHALSNNAFAHEIVPFPFKDTEITQDEPPQKVNPLKFEKLKPAFHPDGTVTAATSSSLADGACVAHITSSKHAINPLARIVDYTQTARAPKEFTKAPVDAINLLLERTGWSVHDVDVFEINEAFAMVPMIAIHDLKLDRDRVNMHGGACTLGHPIGMSGARVVVTLAHALRMHGLKRGIAAACIGGGEATAIAIEAL